MIDPSIIYQSNHWPARSKKVEILLSNILKFHKELMFDKHIKYECNIILGDNKLIKKMNFKFRKKKYATDVLTFVSEINTKKQKKQKICDIFLSAEMIKKDSQRNKNNFYNHMAHLLVHSFLHINGFLHNKIKDFELMKEKEITILKKIGINNPYLYN